MMFECASFKKKEVTHHVEKRFFFLSELFRSFEKFGMQNIHKSTSRYALIMLYVVAVFQREKTAQYT